jgi:hypothetical protein
VSDFGLREAAPLLGTKSGLEFVLSPLHAMRTSDAATADIQPDRAGWFGRRTVLSAWCF